MKKQEIKKLTKTELLKNINKYKKDYLTSDFKKSILKLQIHHKLAKLKK